jgi:hypothetical protein
MIRAPRRVTSSGLCHESSLAFASLSPVRGGRQQHFVVQANDLDSHEGNSVIGAESALMVDVNVKQLVQRGEIAYAPMVWAAVYDPIKA